MDEEYKMGNAVLGRTTQEKDLGVILIADMKVSEQCGIAASKGNQMLGLIMRPITYQETKLTVQSKEGHRQVRKNTKKSN